MSQCAFAGKTAEVIHRICWQTSAKRKLCNLCGVALFLIDECGRVLEDDFGYIEDNELTHLSGALNPGRSYDHVKVDFTARTMTDTVYVIFSDTFLSLYPIEFRLEKDDLAEIADNTVRYCIQVE